MRNPIPASQTPIYHLTFSGYQRGRTLCGARKNRPGSPPQPAILHNMHSPQLCQACREKWESEP